MWCRTTKTPKPSSPILGQISFGATDDGFSSSFDSRLSATNDSVVWSLGVATLGAGLTLQRAATQGGPLSQLNVGVLVQDQDGVAFAASDLTFDSDLNGANDRILLGQTEVRFGRLRLSSSFGPETANLPVDLLLECWDGVAWRTNFDDSCTALALSAARYPAGSTNVAASRNVAVGAGTTTGTYPHATASAIGFAAGNAKHYFSAPGAGNTGSFAVQTGLTSYPWLRFDWNGDGSHTEAALPTATYTFGAYRGHDRVIYWQELLR